MWASFSMNEVLCVSEIYELLGSLLQIIIITILSWILYWESYPFARVQFESESIDVLLC